MQRHVSFHQITAKLCRIAQTLKEVFLSREVWTVLLATVVATCFPLSFVGGEQHG
jgi:hypothetical protein